MSETPVAGKQENELRHDEQTTALFAQLVMQQSNMALMLMGKVPHPQSGEAIQDLDAARLFIDQLEMIEAKTRGNLNKDESAILKQSLMTLRLAFVEAVEGSPGHGTSPAEPQRPTQPAQTPQPEKSTADATAGPTEETESKKKFSKKY